MERTDKYSLNLDKIMEFVFDDVNLRNTEITENYEPSEVNEDNMILANRIIREVKGGDESATANIRYDLIKNLCNFLCNIGNKITNGEPLSFIEETALNTMIEYNFIKKIN